MRKFIFVILIIFKFNLHAQINSEKIVEVELEVREFEDEVVAPKRVKDGKKKTYYKNGKLKAIVEYENFIKKKTTLYATSGYIYYVEKYKKNKSFVEQFYEDGSVFIQAKYIDRKLTGIYKKYRENGNFYLVEKYHHGELMFSKHYYDNGKLKKRRKFKNGKLFNIYSFNSKGEKLNTGSFKNGTGILFSYYTDNGNLNVMHTYWENGKRIRRILLRTYFNNSTQLQSESININKKTVINRKYWSNGNLKEVSKKNKYRIISSKYFYENGQLKESRVYKDGELFNVISSFNPKGEKLKIGTFKDGNGVYFKYDDKGNLVHKGVYKNGKMGKYLASISYRNGNGKRTKEYNCLWTDNGNLKDYCKESGISSITEFLDGKVILIRHYFNNSIQLKSESKTINNEGNYTEYWKNGNVKKISKYNKKTIKASTFYENGQLKESREYKDGKLFNIISSFNPKGEKLNIGTFKNGTGIYFEYDFNGNPVTENEYRDSRSIMTKFF